jgi:H+/Cl- antiporter ClcA
MVTMISIPLISTNKAAITLGMMSLLAGITRHPLRAQQGSSMA